MAQLEEELPQVEPLFFEESQRRKQSLPKSSPPRKAGIMILLYKKNGEYYFPLIQRPTYDGHHSRQIAFPGGKQELADSSLEHTALRETEEEIGVPSSSVKPLGKLSNLYVPPSNFMIYPYIGITHSKMSFIPDPYEVQDILEVNLKSFLSLEVQFYKVEILNGSMNAPGFMIDDKIVWGATAHILSQFRQLLK